MIIDNEIELKRQAAAAKKEQISKTPNLYHSE